MRSRYSAYVVKDGAYLIKTWHQKYRPDEFKLEQNLHWLMLDVLDTLSADNQATVEFEARFLTEGLVNGLHEVSQFIFEDGQWLYTSGEVKALTFKPWRPGRNESCPCGSQRKFKRCCLQD